MAVNERTVHGLPASNVLRPKSRARELNPRTFLIELPEGWDMVRVREHPECLRAMQLSMDFANLSVRGLVPLDRIVFIEHELKAFECVVVGVDDNGDVHLGSARSLGQLSKPYGKSLAEAEQRFRQGGKRTDTQTKLEKTEEELAAAKAEIARFKDSGVSATFSEQYGRVS